MYVSWLSDETIEDGILWNVNTANDAADKYVDDHVIPNWSDLGCPQKVTVCVQKHEENDSPIESYVYDIEAEPVRSMGRRASVI